MDLRYSALNNLNFGCNRENKSLTAPKTQTIKRHIFSLEERIGERKERIHSHRKTRLAFSTIAEAPRETPKKGNLFVRRRESRVSRGGDSLRRPRRHRRRRCPRDSRTLVSIAQSFSRIVMSRTVIAKCLSIRLDWMKLAWDTLRCEKVIIVRKV